MNVVDGRPIVLHREHGVVMILVQGRKVMELPYGAVEDFAKGVVARKVGEYEIAATDDGRPVTVVWSVDAHKPTIVKVKGRKVLQLDTENAEQLYSALTRGGSGVPFPASDPPPPDSGEEAGLVGNAAGATQSDESPAATEEAPPRFTVAGLLAERQPAREFELVNVPLKVAPDHSRVYTAEEVAKYQTSEAELVSEPLQRRIAELEAKLEFPEPNLSRVVLLSNLDVNAYAPREYRQSRSWSQLTAYEECGYCYLRYRADEKGVRLEERPAWWNLGGTALHDSFEEFERLLWMIDVRFENAKKFMVETFAKNFKRLIHETELRSDWQKNEWRAANRGREGEGWWWGTGTNMALVYADEYEKGRDWVLAEHDGEPMLEFEFNVPFGNVWFHGFMDRVVSRDGKLWVDDYKSGAKPANDPGQTCAYAHALDYLYPGEVGGSRIFMARTGEYIEYPLGHIPFELIAERLDMMDRAERAGVYLPNLSGYGHQCIYYTERL